MRAKELERREGGRTLLVVFDIVDDVGAGLVQSRASHPFPTLTPACSGP